jgi:hypothetical protein
VQTTVRGLSASVSVRRCHHYNGAAAEMVHVSTQKRCFRHHRNCDLYGAYAERRIVSAAFRRRFGRS